MDLKIKDNPQFKQGYLYAVRLLAASKKSSKEILKRLNDKGYDAAIAEIIVEMLKDQGILSDRKMVDDTVHWAKQAKRYGKRRIAIELRKKGIAQNVIDEALVGYSKDEERAAAYQLAEARWNKLGKIELVKRKKRLFDFLVSRGFDFDLTREIINQLNSKKNNEDI